MLSKEKADEKLSLLYMFKLGVREKVKVPLFSVNFLLILVTAKVMSYLRYTHLDGAKGISTLQPKFSSSVHRDEQPSPS